jgi:rhamnulokinase
VNLDLEDGAFFAPGDPEASLRGFLRRTGQASDVDAGTLVRGYLEGLALMYRRAIDDLESLTGKAVRRICLVGGGCRNGTYCQFVANAAGREVLAGPVEATASGNIGLQCLADGTLSSAAEVRDLVRRSFPPVSYTPADRQQWQDAYGRYQGLVARRNA